MDQFEVVKYQSIHFPLWNEFISRSKNATFLFHRDFMEYHKDRFEDYSLLIFKNAKLVCVIPAHRKNQQFCSHLGLTYGGFVFSGNEKIPLVKDVLDKTINFLKLQGFNEMLVKILPTIYNPERSSALEYFLFQQKAQLLKRDLNFIVDLHKAVPMHKKKKKIMQKAYVEELRVVEEVDLSGFWKQVLMPVLQERFAADPVHSVQEISLLTKRFPQHIRQFNVYSKNVLLAGMTMFIDNKVAKSQYGAVTEAGKAFRALDFLHLFLYEKMKAEGQHYFDLGITNEDNGYTYNVGLSNYKEELGAVPKNQDQYLLQL